jgi:hypothetical protein
MARQTSMAAPIWGRSRVVRRDAEKRRAHGQRRAAERRLTDGQRISFNRPIPRDSRSRGILRLPRGVWWRFLLAGSRTRATCAG